MVWEGEERDVTLGGSYSGLSPLPLPLPLPAAFKIQVRERWARGEEVETLRQWREPGAATRSMWPRTVRHRSSALVKV